MKASNQAKANHPPHVEIVLFVEFTGKVTFAFGAGAKTEKKGQDNQLAANLTEVCCHAHTII